MHLDIQEELTLHFKADCPLIFVLTQEEARAQTIVDDKRAWLGIEDRMLFGDAGVLGANVCTRRGSQHVASHTDQVGRAVFIEGVGDQYAKYGVQFGLHAR